MNKRIFGFGTAFLVCTLGIAQQTQKDSLPLQQLDEVVVSDSRFHIKRENSGKVIIKIDEAELQRHQGKSVAEIINTKGGFEIAGSRGNDGNVLGVFARGGRGRQVLLLIDGVQVSDPSSSSLEYDFRLLSTANIAAIEIIKGAASTLYGTNAATAVIHITTKSASSEAIGGNFQSSWGTNHSAQDQNYNLAEFSNAARISGTLANFNYLVGFSNRFSSGLSAIKTPDNEEDVFSHFSTDLKLGYTFSDAFTFQVYGNHTKIATDYDESFGLMDAPNQYLSEQSRIGLSSEYRRKKGSLHLNAAYSDYDSEDISSFGGFFKAKNTVVDVYHKYQFNEHWFTVLGLNYIQDQAEFGATEEFSILDPYANVVYITPFGLNLNAGIRLNTHSEYGTHLVYNLNPSYTITTTKGYYKVFGSYATSYITPSLVQLFGNFGPNPNLDPEDDRTLEGGMEFALKKKLRISGAYFNRKEKDFVFFDNALFLYQNAQNTIDAQGFEVELDWQLTQKIRLNGNYTFTERKGDSAIRIPKNKVNLGLDYTFTDRTFASVNYAFTGKRTDTDFNTFTNVNLDAYSLAGVYLSHAFIPQKFRVFANVTNLFNTDFEEVVGFTTKGRNIRLGMNLTL
ncbi:TonB-dependent receptor [Arenibacter sp. GZD96]|uniref:TonB-dependent receptor plug domain-containing protein n=1 Tax=Aurantibrevibacter litoralis TaxID=3106030 RepID=UPI002AFF541B|nr:TonB-dependent receptor plug domain-containing protein [Arenibacter sp. GZD-96]MEA1786907.1 TonB-dependent receptor [Arenibacter sp. GZD-96]